MSLIECSAPKPIESRCGCAPEEIIVTSIPLVLMQGNNLGISHVLQ